MTFEYSVRSGAAQRIPPEREMPNHALRSPEGPSSDSPGEPLSATSELRAAAPSVASELTGDLPCVRCRYNLRGISIRDKCPECGTPVRATILARVDPYAPLLRPISLPLVTAVGLVVWPLGALTAAGATWAIRLRELAAELTGRAGATPTLIAVAVWGIVASAAGAAVLIRPHAGIKPRQIAAAAAGVLVLLTLAVMQRHLLVSLDAVGPRPYASDPLPLVERSLHRLLMGSAAAAVVLALRGNARLLASRSMLLRSGRVDRQTMAAMIGALGVSALGDVVHLVAPWADPAGHAGLNEIGTFLIAGGSVLFTIGLVGVLVDCVRIAPVVLRPPLAIGQLVAPPPQAPPPPAPPPPPSPPGTRPAAAS